MSSLKSETTSPSIALWIQNRESYVNVINSVCLRVKNASKLGENLRGFADGSGELTEMSWSDVMKLRPTILEINNSRNPFSELVDSLETAPEDEVKVFLSRLRFISLSMTNINCGDLIRLLKRLTLLEGFAFYDTRFSKDEWQQIADELLRLNVRAVDISDDVMDCLLQKIDVDLLKLSGSPGVSVDAIKASTSSYVAVKILVAQDLNFTDNLDAEELLDIIPLKFPRLSAILWDWSMVDPAMTIDERTKTVIQKIIKVYKELSMHTFALVAYTPCGQTKHAAGEVARLLGETLPDVQLHRFSSRGLEQCEPNFTLIIAGEHLDMREDVYKIYALGRNSIPDLRHLLGLISPDAPSLYPALLADFGGFNTTSVKNVFSKKSWNDNIQI